MSETERRRTANNGLQIRYGMDESNPPSPCSRWLMPQKREFKISTEISDIIPQGEMNLIKNREALIGFASTTTLVSRVTPCPPLPAVSSPCSQPPVSSPCHLMAPPTTSRRSMAFNVFDGLDTFFLLLLLSSFYYHGREILGPFPAEAEGERLLVG